MKRFFYSIILCGLITASCSPTKNTSSGTSGGQGEQAKPKPKTTEEIITELRKRIDSLVDIMKDQQYAKEPSKVFDSSMYNGALGDVKYSVLPPGKFYEINGKDCWRLLDSTRFVETDLYRETRNTGLGDTLPDGRGVFVRGMMFNKKDTITGDQDKKRVVGSYQADQVKSHQHDITLYQKYGFHETSKGGTAKDMKEDEQYHFKTEEDKIKNEGRPKNIALYIYIRVNYLCKPGK